jgi:uncharacterized membrane protein
MKKDSSHNQVIHGGSHTKFSKLRTWQRTEPSISLTVSGGGEDGFGGGGGGGGGCDGG